MCVTGTSRAAIGRPYSPVAEAAAADLKQTARQVMTRLFAILVTLFLVAIPAKADVALWPRPVPGWTVIQVYGVIKEEDVATFETYTENVDPAATLVIVTGPEDHSVGVRSKFPVILPGAGDLSTGIRMGLRVHLKKLIVGAMGKCTSSCALIWAGGETGRKFFYQPRPGVPFTLLCFHTSWETPSGHMLPAPSNSGNAAVDQYLTALGYNQDMIEWATGTDLQHLRCLNPELAKKFNIDFWYNTEDGQHYKLPGDHGLLPTMSAAATAAQSQTNDSDFPQQMAAMMYNTPGSDLLELTQVVGSCNKGESYFNAWRGGSDYKRPFPCDKGALLQGTGNRRHVAFGYGNNAIAFGGAYDKDTNSIVINQLFFPNVDAVQKATFVDDLPADTDPVLEAVKKAVINGVIENHLEGKCYNKERNVSIGDNWVYCRAHYKNDEQKNEFFIFIKMSYVKLINVTEQVKKLGQ